MPSLLCLLRRYIDFNLVDNFYWQHVWEIPFHTILFPDEIGIGIIGLDLGIMKTLASIIKDQSQTDELMEIKPIDRNEFVSELKGGASFYGSVFSDGTLLGEIRIRPQQTPDFKKETLYL